MFDKSELYKFENEIIIPKTDIISKNDENFENKINTTNNQIVEKKLVNFKNICSIYLMHLFVSGILFILIV